MVLDASDSLLDRIARMDIRCEGRFTQGNGLDLPILAINLDRRPDRWLALQQRFSAVGLDRLIRAPAIDGTGLDLDAVSSLLATPHSHVDDMPGCHLALTRPAIGCFLSHVAVWRWIRANDLPYALVLEDDAYPAHGFTVERLSHLLESEQTQSGMIFLGCVVMGGLAERADDEPLARLYYFNGTFAYLVSAKACQRLLRNMLPMRMHVDHQISQWLVDRRSEFSAWHAQPALFAPDWSLGSDCHVRLSDTNAADHAMWRIFAGIRRELEGEGRMLLADDTPALAA